MQQSLILAALTVVLGSATAASQTFHPDGAALTMFSQGCLTRQNDFLTHNLKPFLFDAALAARADTQLVVPADALFGTAWIFGGNEGYQGFLGALFVTADDRGELWGHCRLTVGRPVDTLLLGELFAATTPGTAMIEDQAIGTVKIETYEITIDAGTFTVEFLLSGEPQPLAVITASRMIASRLP